MSTASLIRYILLDIDDTIISTSNIPTPKSGESDKYLSLHNGLIKLSWIIKQSNDGLMPPLGFCTGREASYVLGICRSFREIPNSWSVVECGLILFNPKTQKRLYHPAFTQEMEKVFEEINRLRIPRLAENFPFLRFYKGKEVNIAVELKDGASSSLSEVEQLMRESFEDVRSYLEINTSKTAVDISPKGVDKGTGVAFLAKTTGVPLSGMLLIDDSLGARPALDRIGHIACPGNASENLKKLVAEKNGYESSLELAEGVVDAISHFTGVKVP